MKPIIEYQDYHAFLSDYYEERKRTSAFSWREFAKIAGFVSPSYLKDVCCGKTNLSKVTMGRVAAAIGLVGHEVDYFEAMVQFGNAKTDDVKRKFLEQMHSIAFNHKVRIVDKDAFEYYDSWKNPVVRELAPLMPGAMPGEIAKACTQDVSALEVRKSLAFLVRAAQSRSDRKRDTKGYQKQANGKHKISFCVFFFLHLSNFFAVLRIIHYHKVTFPIVPRSSVAVPTPNALKTRLIVGIVTLCPFSMREI